jgi:periplasmic protein TonB
LDFYLAGMFAQVRSLGLASLVQAAILLLFLHLVGSETSPMAGAQQRLSSFDVSTPEAAPEPVLRVAAPSAPAAAPRETPPMPSSRLVAEPAGQAVVPGTALAPPAPITSIEGAGVANGIAPLRATAPAPLAGAVEVHRASQGQDQYARHVLAWIEARKSFPRDLASRLREGVVHVRFTLDGRGRVIHCGIVRTSGMTWLDKLALSQIREASPFPRPPAGLAEEGRVFEVPLRYRSS